MSELGLTPKGRIDPARLDRENYVQSLTEEAVRCGIMTEGDTDRLRTELLSVLAQVIGYKTGGESTNVSTDDARILSESILYNIGTALRAESDPDTAAATLRDRPASELYAKGWAVNKAHWEEARRLWTKVRYNRPREADAEFDRALDRNIRIYLERYDPRTTAHDRLYLSLPRFGIRGAYHIRGAVSVLRRLLEIGTGSAQNRTDAAFRVKGEEPNS